METPVVDRMIKNLEWQTKNSMYTTQDNIDLLAELKALKQVLDLFNVSKRFCLCEEPDENWDSVLTCFCGKCGKLVDSC